MPDKIKILTYDTYEGVFTAYLSLDDQVEMTIFVPTNKTIGTRLAWHELPWQARQHFESEMDPHEL